MIRTLKIQRTESHRYVVEIEAETSAARSIIDIAVDDHGTMALVEHAAYEEFLKHLDEAKSLAHRVLRKEWMQWDDGGSPFAARISSHLAGLE
ncbi:MAG TPA: hypothetical protein VFE63_14825 [Roseiarcus sp.]|jgi:hypothetical protein|nr:hypothetical protein [Roseiarcus sp.]